MDGQVISYFSSKINDVEAKLLDQKIGDASSQQTFEALAALVALRIWRTHWLGQRFCFKVRSDSVSALVVFLRLKTSGRGPGIVAREMALDISDSLYRPDIGEHVPGIANKACDTLSRKHQPGVHFQLPPFLCQVPEAHVPIRDKSFYRSLCAPR